MKKAKVALITGLTWGLTVPVALSAFSVTWQSKRTLIFREDWKEIPAEIPVTQDHVANPQLRLYRYGTSADRIKKSNHPEIPNDPFYVWSGECDGTWAVTLSLNDGRPVDLSEGVIRWRSRQSGGHSLRVLIRLPDGRFFVSDQGDDRSDDWHVHEFVAEELTWREVDLNSFQLAPETGLPDLKQVWEIGFTDLKAGRGSDYSSRVDWIEVLGSNN
ncbi:MAG TPA: hypothetical protein VKZ59_08490 [Acidobacteriota bacterium]|nr:hypothetical protein [Acidobacteriota bacterium]